jgi:hypothetical protein
MSSPGRKDDAGKLRWSLLPIRAVEDVIRVLEVGAARYGDENWRKVQNRRLRYFDATCRHLFKWFIGQRIDPETGISHLAAVACNALFLAEIDMEEQ